MYPKFLFLFVVLAIVGFSSAKKLEEITIKTNTYCDHFEICESGKTRLEKELTLTPGVKTVKIDSKAMTINIKYNPKRTNPEKIRKVISQAGYDADDVKADPKAYEKLDECCRKK
ncbi:MAG: heavy-metal-associated domain-containing protein [Bacteroidota bacterium]|nr:heavy-metal-associated domain-containing protein [Bacteroidota bacterium]